MYRAEPAGDYWVVVGPELPLGPDAMRLITLYESLEEAEHIARRMDYARKVALSP